MPLDAHVSCNGRILEGGGWQNNIVYTQMAIQINTLAPAQMFNQYTAMLYTKLSVNLSRVQLN